MANSRWTNPDKLASDEASQITDQFFYGLQQRRRTGAIPYGQAAKVNDAESGEVRSNSEIFLNSYQPNVEITPDAMAKMSPDRQQYLKETNERAQTAPRARPDMGIASNVKSARTISTKEGIFKTASVQGANLSGGLSSSSNSNHLAPDVYSPFYLTQNMQLPRDRFVANAWNRAFYEVNPYVRNAINLHATYPISKINIKCEDKRVEQFFLDMADKLDLQTVVQNAALELWKLGEVFNYASFDESSGCWDQIYQLNPDFVRVKASPLQTATPSFSLKPDPELIKIITSNDPEHVRLREQIDPKIVHHVLLNEAIPLDNFNISHLKMLNSPYDIRGTSVIVSVWKHLMWYDKIIEAKLAQADGMINPITLIKIGAAGDEGYYPRPDEIEAWRQVFEAAQYDKDFKIVTHADVNVEQKGYSGTVLDTSSDITFIIDSILTGLMVPKTIMTQEGSSYASASVGLDVMRQRYNSFRVMMGNWLEKKIFAPISEVQGFYKLDGGKKKLIVPTIDWNAMTLYDLDTYIQHITTLSQANKVSQRTLDRSLGLNRVNETTNIRQEMIEEAIRQREEEALGAMTLAELRALDPEEPIVAQESMPLAGVKPLQQGGGAGGAAAGGMGDAGGAGFDLGGLGGGGGGASLDLGAPPSGAPGPLPGAGAEAPPSPPPPGGKG